MLQIIQMHDKVPVLEKQQGCKGGLTNLKDHNLTQKHYIQHFTPKQTIGSGLLILEDWDIH